MALAGSQIWWTWKSRTCSSACAGEQARDERVRQEAHRPTHGAHDDGARRPDGLSKINQLIIIDVHAHIIDAFVRDSVLDAREFAWESQLGFSWTKKGDDIQVNQCTGKFDFCTSTWA